jgi:uncharacterized protein YukE
MAKYLTADEIIRKVRTKLPVMADAWARETTKGFETKWSAWAKTMYKEVIPVVQGLPEKTGDIDADVMARSKPVGEAISMASASYRAARLEELLKKLG